MKRKLSFTGLAIVIFSAFLVIKFNAGAKTIEKAIDATGLKPAGIIHEEKTDKGSIVFAFNPAEDILYTAFVRKNIGGFKTAYSGVQGDAKFAANKLGVTNSYFPGIEGTSLPIYFGLIGDPDAEQIEFVEKKRNIEGQAKIINANGIRIWLVYMNKFEGSEFDIIGLSKEGKELIKIDGGISPYSADQKPFKSPYS